MPNKSSMDKWLIWYWMDWKSPRNLLWGLYSPSSMMSHSLWNVIDLDVLVPDLLPTACCSYDSTFTCETISVLKRHVSPFYPLSSSALNPDIIEPLVIPVSMATWVKSSCGRWEDGVREPAGKCLSVQAVRVVGFLSSLWLLSYFEILTLKKRWRNSPRRYVIECLDTNNLP